MKEAQTLGNLFVEGAEPLQGINIPTLCIAAKRTNHYAISVSTSVCQNAVFILNECEKFSRNF